MITMRVILFQISFNFALKSERSRLLFKFKFRLTQKIHSLLTSPWVGVRPSALCSLRCLIVKKSQKTYLKKLSIVFCTFLPYLGFQSLSTSILTGQHINNYFNPLLEKANWCNQRINILHTYLPGCLQNDTNLN